MSDTYVMFVTADGGVKEMYRNGRLAWHGDGPKLKPPYTRVAGREAEDRYWAHYERVREIVEKDLASTDPVEHARGVRMKSTLTRNGCWERPTAIT